MKRGKLITIEGIDGAGKTTLAEALADSLGSSGYDVELLREPGGVELSEQIRRLVKDPTSDIEPRAEALLYAASRAQLVQRRILPLLSVGRIVLLDRFVDSSLAYQGGGRRLEVSEIAAINRFATNGLYPDLTLLLRLDCDLARKRSSSRGEHDRLETEGLRFFEQVTEVYLQLARENPQRYRTIDASQNADTMLKTALSIVQPTLDAVSP